MELLELISDYLGKINGAVVYLISINIFYKPLEPSVGSSSNYDYTFLSHSEPEAFPNQNYF